MQNAFKPSEHFVDSVMKNVETYEHSRNTGRFASAKSFLITIGEILFAVSGVALGAINAARFFLNILAPVVCH